MSLEQLNKIHHVSLNLCCRATKRSFSNHKITKRTTFMLKSFEF